MTRICRFVRLIVAFLAAVLTSSYSTAQSAPPGTGRFGVSSRSVSEKINIQKLLNDAEAKAHHVMVEAQTAAEEAQKAAEKAQNVAQAAEARYQALQSKGGELGLSSEAIAALSQAHTEVSVAKEDAEVAKEDANVKLVAAASAFTEYERAQVAAKGLSTVKSQNGNFQATSPVLFRATSGKTSDIDAVTVQNLTGTDYVLSNTPPLNNGFSAKPCQDGLIPAKSFCVIRVTYTPKSVGPGVAKLELQFKGLDGSEADTLEVPLSGFGFSTCDGTTKAFAPLTGKGIKTETINCYYNSTSDLSFANQVAYQYNPVGSASNVSSDLASLRFPQGFQLVLAGTAKADSCSSTQNQSSSCGGAVQAGSPSGNQPSLQQDIQTLTNGGDFALRTNWPLLNYRGGPFQIRSDVNPRVGFEVNGLGGQASAANATNVLPYISNETYLQVDALSASGDGDSPGAVYFDYTWGLQHVSSDFSKSAGLDKENFLLQQIAVGVVFAGKINLSGQHYWGPTQAFVDSSGKPAGTVNNFSTWQFRIQITPKSVISNGS